MSEVIEIDSSDEEPAVKKLKINNKSVRLIPISSIANKNKSEIVELSDDEGKSISETEQVIDCESIKNKDENENKSQIDDKKYNNIKEKENISENLNHINNENGSDLLIENKQSEKEECDNRLQQLIDSFIETCINSVKNAKYATLVSQKSQILIKEFKLCKSKLDNFNYFTKLIINSTNKAKESAARAVIAFNEVYNFVKEFANANSVEVTSDERHKLNKLEKTLKLLCAKISELENAEVNFDDEENSSYIMLERFQQRLKKVYSKYCQLLKTNPYKGRLTYNKLVFTNSKYNEINNAISKKYKNNLKFPSYFEMEKFIKKVVEDEKLPLSETEIKNESIHCFKKLGELLQTRRKKELYEAHYWYIEKSDDPAQGDTSLNAILQKNYAEGLKKIDELCEEYASKTKEELVEDNESENDDTDITDDEINEVDSDKEESEKDEDVK